MDVSRRLQSVGLSRFDERVTSRAGFGALRGICEQPGLSAQSERADGVLGTGIADLQIAPFTVAHQGIPLVQGVVHGLAGDIRKLSLPEIVHLNPERDPVPQAAGF